MESIHSFDQLQRRLEEAQYVGLIQCQLAGSLLYTIDMQRCDALLRELASTSDPLQSLGKSIVQSISPGDSWLQFYDDFSDLDESLHHIHRMLDCTELIPWHTFYVFDNQYGAGRPLDLSSDGDLPLLHAATLLSRHITKQLEQAGYEQLHQRLNNLKEKPSQRAIGLLLTTLLSLRRRWCMWEKLPSLEGKANWSHRVYKTAQTLYFHYFNAIDQPPSLQDTISRPRFMRQTLWQSLFPLSRRASQRPQEEDVPTDHSPEGFDKWLREGSKYLPWEDTQLGQFFHHGVQPSGNSVQYGGRFLYA